MSNIKPSAMDETNLALLEAFTRAESQPVQVLRIPLQPMETAPKDRHILVKNETWHYQVGSGKATEHWVPSGWKPSGTQIIEAWFHPEKQKWVEWCGNERILTSDVLRPLGWYPSFE